MKNISRIICAALALTLCTAMLPTAHASGLGGLYNKSQNQFWQIFDGLTNGNGPDSVHSAAPAATPNPTTETATETPAAAEETEAVPPSTAPTDTPAPEETTPAQATSEPTDQVPEATAASADQAPVATTSVTESTTIINNTTNNVHNGDTFYIQPSDAPKYTSVDDGEYIYVNGERYHRVDEGGELVVNDKMYSRDDEAAKPKKESLWDLMVQDWNLRTKMFVQCIPIYIIILAVVFYRMYKKSHRKRR